MPGNATGSLIVQSDYTSKITTNTAGEAQDKLSLAYRPKWTNGAGAIQFDEAASASGSLNNANVTYTLSAMPRLGSTVAFTKVREIVVRNEADPAVVGNTLTVAPGDTNPWAAGFAGAVTIPAGGIFVLVAPTAAGLAVGVGATDKVKLSTTGVVPYTIAIKGATA